MHLLYPASSLQTIQKFWIHSYLCLYLRSLLPMTKGALLLIWISHHLGDKSNSGSSVSKRWMHSRHDRLQDVSLSWHWLITSGIDWWRSSLFTLLWKTLTSFPNDSCFQFEVRKQLISGCRMCFSDRSLRRRRSHPSTFLIHVFNTQLDWRNLSQFAFGTVRTSHSWMQASLYHKAGRFRSDPYTQFLFVLPAP